MMAGMKLALAAAAALLALQDPAVKKQAEAGDYLHLHDRTELKGAIESFSAAGRIRFRIAGADKPVELGLEEVARIRFSNDDIRPSSPTGEQIRLAGGGTVSGKLTSYEGDVAVVESAAGAVRLRRKDIKAVLLGTPESLLPTLHDEKKDILIREVVKKAEATEKPGRECLAEYGRLVSIGASVRFETSAAGETGPKTEIRDFDRASVKHIYIHREAGGPELPPGLFAKVTLRNGDRWVAVIQAVAADHVRLFSHVLGTVQVDKVKIHTLAILQQAQLTAGNILITDQMGIHEFDSQKVEVWTWTQGGQGAAIARKLRNGNVLFADPNTNSVQEIKPAGRTGGDVVWRLDEVQNPRDVSRLENGNTLVTEYYNRVAEFDAKTREVVWQCPVTYPMSAQRLENGNTLIATNNSVIEVNHDKQPREVWRANLLRGGAIRPHRATRLENGNTLITDLQRGQVVELDANSVEVWKVQGLSTPVSAVRLEDGNTLILEQGGNRVVEVDPANPRQRIDGPRKGLTIPQGMTTY